MPPESRVDRHDFVSDQRVLSTSVKEPLVRPIDVFSA